MRKFDKIDWIACFTGIALLGTVMYAGTKQARVEASCLKACETTFATKGWPVKEAVLGKYMCACYGEGNNGEFYFAGMPRKELK